MAHFVGTWGVVAQHTLSLAWGIIGHHFHGVWGQ